MAIVLPHLDVEKVRRWCRERCPAELKEEVRLEVSTRGKSVSIHECRPVWRGAPGEWTETPIAQLRYEGDGTWTLYSSDRYGKWMMYVALDTSQRIDAVLDEIGADPAGIFWG